MAIKPAEKKQTIINELEELEPDDLMQTLEALDDYTVPTPSEKDTDRLLAALSPVLKEQFIHNTDLEKREHFFILPQLRLAISQTRLLSFPFIALSILVSLCGIAAANMLNGNTVRFLANAAPLLGILTIMYQFRSNYNHMDELEAACPYTRSQLAAAKLLVVLGYDILLCLILTPFVNMGNYMLWQIIIHWLAPLILTLGIALFCSMQFGIWGGCLISTAVWAANLAISKNGKNIFSVLSPTAPAIYLDLISIMLGIALLVFFLHHLSHSATEL